MYEKINFNNVYCFKTFMYFSVDYKLNGCYSAHAIGLR